MDEEREIHMLQFLRHAFVLPVLVTAMLLLTGCLGDNVKKESAAEAKSKEMWDNYFKWQRERESSESQALLALLASGRLYSADGAPIVINFGGKEKESLEMGTHGSSKSNEQSASSLKKDSGLYWILFGIGVFILVCGFGLMTFIVIVAWMWYKWQRQQAGMGVIDFLRNQAQNFNVGTEAWNAFQTAKNAVKNQFNIK
jgi:hypothetical protein